MNVFADSAVQDYLVQLRTCGAGLAPGEFDELWETVREHIAESAHRGEPVSQVLARLGSPEEIVAAAHESDAPAGTAVAAPTRSRNWPTVLTLVLLAGGIAICGVGWIVGVVLLWMSDRWKLWEKVVGTVLLPAVLAVTQWLQVRNGGSDSISSLSATWALLIALVMNAVFVGYLAFKARPGRAGFRR